MVRDSRRRGGLLSTGALMFCEYCASNALPDERGNCGSCGAPLRSPQTIMQPIMTNYNMTIRPGVSVSIFEKQIRDAIYKGSAFIEIERTASRMITGIKELV